VSAVSSVTGGSSPPERAASRAGEDDARIGAERAAGFQHVARAVEIDPVAEVEIRPRRRR
jgi:hypothetical protein